jgi:hypothetical protein
MIYGVGDWKDNERRCEKKERFTHAGDGEMN